MSESAISPAEIIPSMEMDGLSVSLKALDGLSLTLDALATQATDIEVTNQEEYAKAGYILVDVRNVAKDAKNELAPFESIVQRVKTFLLQRRQKIDNRCTEIHGVLAQKMAAFSATEKAAAAKEQAKLNNGKKVAQCITVEPDIPKVAGVRRHKVWRFTVVDQKKVPDSWWVIDEQAIGARVREIADKAKAEKEIPGIAVECKERF